LQLLRFRRGGRRWLILAGAALVWLVSVLPCPSSAYTLLQPLQPRQEVAVLGNGVVWVDEQRVLFQGFWSGSAMLGRIEGSNSTLASSDNAVAVLGDGPREGFAAAVPPGRLAPIEQIDEGVRGGECSSWVPMTATASHPGEFAVAGDELIDPGECQGEPGEQETATRQPLFVRNVHGGKWHVLRWLNGHYPPMLATEGSLLAIGVQLSRANMRVTILDLVTGHLVARFEAPDGFLSFASSHRLMLSVPLPLQAEPRTGLPPTTAVATPAPRVRRLAPYRIELYSLSGRRLADLGTAAQPPLVSHMHVVAYESVEGGSALTVRSLLGKESRRLIGFNEPARRLLGLAFRWPAVAAVETTSAPLSQSEVTCQSGEYHPPSKPFLAIFDVARSKPYVPPPPSAHLAPPPRNCPPLPKYAAGG
jgi:hypothetical protein